MKKKKVLKNKGKNILIIVLIIIILSLIVFSYFFDIEIDEDGFGLSTRKPGVSKMQCNDKVDNDGNGLCDYYGCKIAGQELEPDPGCESLLDDDESSAGEDSDEDAGSASGCNDTDGGKNYYEQGQVYSIVGPNAPESGEDSCLDENLQYIQTNGTHLREIYCNSQGMYESDVVLCLYGCEYGACIKGYYNINCSDSDEGINPYKKGYVYNAFDYESPKIYDECRTNAFGIEEDVKEVYCNPDRMFDTKFIECQNNCFDGACVGTELISYYPLDGNAEDAFGDNEGAVRGAIETEGLIGTALEFDGIDDSVLIQHDNSLNPYDSDFAMMFWFKCSSCLDTDISRKGSTYTTPDSNLWYKMEVGGYGVADRLSLQFNGENDGATLESVKDVCDGVWHFGLGQRVGDFAELWIDGVKQTGSILSRTDNTLSGSIYNNANLSIGSKDTQDDDFFRGSIDEVRYYKGSFTESEILAFYNENKPN